MVVDLVVCTVDCVADLLPHSIARCMMKFVVECLKDCLADLWQNDRTDVPIKGILVRCIIITAW